MQRLLKRASNANARWVLFAITLQDLNTRSPLSVKNAKTSIFGTELEIREIGNKRLETEID
jgi:hypothetical protein